MSKPRSQQQTLNFKVVKRRIEDDPRHEKKRRLATSSACTSSSTQESERPKEKEREKEVTTPKRTPLSTPTKSPSSLTKFTSIEFLSPVKSSPSKQTRRALRYEHLTTSTTPSQRDLPLPYHYQLVEEKYHNVNIVLSMLEGRKEICTFNKLQKSVQEIMRKSFKMEDIARIKYLCPDSLILSQERHLPGTTSKEEHNSYQLVIQSNVKKWSPTVLLERRKDIHDKLLSQTIAHHKVFLSGLSVSVPDSELYRWHVNFELQQVPDIPQHDLPHPPINDSYTSASDLLTQTERKLSSRVQTALERVNNNNNTCNTCNDSKATNSVPSTDPLLKGVSPAIIERIRKKEAIKAALDISRDPHNEHQLLMLSRLPEMSRIIRSLFVTEGKAAILWSHLLEKIKDSHSSTLSTDQVNEHVQLILDTVPRWCTVVHARGNKYLKVKDKGMSHQKITELINNKYTQLNSTN